MAKSHVDPGHVGSLAVERWHVYNASHVLVATYLTEAAAAAHVACWPALYYSAGPLFATTAESATGPSISIISA